MKKFHSYSYHNVIAIEMGYNGEGGRNIKIIYLNVIKMINCNICMEFRQLIVSNIVKIVIKMLGQKTLSLW